MKMPNTFFSTRLSGNAKETELRIRNIFQWKKKNPPAVLCLVIALAVLSCFGLFSCVPAEREAPVADPSPSAVFSADFSDVSQNSKPLPLPDVVPEEPVPVSSPEELAVQEAGDVLNGFRHPREIINKTILGQDMEFYLYHGNGWTIHVPVHWTDNSYDGWWVAPSGNASFQVGKQFLSVENPKWYRAQQGAWRHDTDYAPPFDYYYEDDGGYTPPEGSADYVYFFAPDGDDRSYEFTLCTTVGLVTEEEIAIQEAMLLSFALDDSSHVLNTQNYVSGATEWEAATAALLAENEPLMFFLSGSGTHIEAHGKQTPDYVSYALALRDFVPGEFVETYFGNRPEGADVLGRDMITLYLPDLKLRLYCYDGSSWIHITQAGEDYWAQVAHRDDRDARIFDAARAWLSASSTSA